MIHCRIVIRVRNVGPNRGRKPRLSDSYVLSEFINVEYQRLKWKLLPNASVPSIIVQNDKGIGSKRIQVEIEEYNNDLTEFDTIILPTDTIFADKFMELYNA